MKAKTLYVLLAVVLAAALVYVYIGLDVSETGLDSSTSTSTPTPTSTIIEDPYAEARLFMVERHLKPRGIVDVKVLEVMGSTPRQEFVPDSLRERAYADNPLPIGEGQTISQPYIVALMTESLRLSETDKVLEVGTGSGYQAAVLAGIVNETYSIEIIEPLAVRANSTLHRLGYDVVVKHGDGYYGWEEHAPFDAIIVTAAAGHIPGPLVDQLKEGGRLVIPVGSTKYYQTLMLVEKRNGSLETHYIANVRFVPMTGHILADSSG